MWRILHTYTHADRPLHHAPPHPHVKKGVLTQNVARPVRLHTQEIMRTAAMAKHQPELLVREKRTVTHSGRTQSGKWVPSKNMGTFPPKSSELLNKTGTFGRG